MTTAPSTTEDVARATSGEAEGRPTNGAHAESAKPITIMLPDDTLKKLKIVAILKGTSLSDLVADAAAGVVKRELKKALSKLGE